jgi:hypothetical protein
MTRYVHSLRFVVLAAALAALLLAACGGDDDDDGTANGSVTTEAAADASGTAQAGARRTREPLPTPTPVAEDQPLFTAAFASTQIQPTKADLEAMPQTEVDGEEGVSLADLAAAVEAPEGATVTIQGYIADATEQRFARDSLATIGTNTILVIEDGRVRLVSSSLPEEQILDVVTTVEFQ